MWSLKVEQITRLQIELTDYCNAHCPMCDREQQYMDKQSLNKHLISFDKYRSILQNDKWSSLYRIHFCGNYDEPTTHPDIYDICKWTLENFKVSLIIATNGGTRNRQFWNDLGSLSKQHKGRLQVTWGIDGLKDTNHIYRKGVKWDKLEENFKAYNGAGGRSRWQFIVFDHNHHQLEHIKKSYRQMGFSSLKVIETYRKAGTESNVIPVSIKEDNKTSEPIKKVTHDQKDNKISKQIKKDVETKSIMTHVKCKALYSESTLGRSLYISSNGNVTPCCWMGTKRSIQYTRESFKKSPHLTKLKLRKSVHKSIDLDRIMNDDNNINNYEKMSDVLGSGYFELLKTAIADKTSKTCNMNCTIKIGQHNSKDFSVSGRAYYQ